MNEAIRQLSPTIAPPPPPAHPHTDTDHVAAAFILGTCVAAVAAWMSWRHIAAVRRRRRLRRELVSIPNDGDIAAVAQRLALLVRAYRLQLPEEWWTAVNTLRFRRPAPDDLDRLAGLRNQVLTGSSRDD